jgi:hypothetical protein
VSQRYRVARQQAARIIWILQTASRPWLKPDLDPVTFLGFERQVPFTGQISAPYRLDIALTHHDCRRKDAT